jgi:membrane-associated phospholipid phosphatase
MYEPVYGAQAPTRGGRSAAGTNPAAGPLGVAGACLAALTLVYLVAAHVPAAELRDAVALHDLAVLNRPSVESVGNFVLHLLDPGVYVLWAAAIVAVALARRRPRVALAAAAVMALAPFTAETLKPLLAHPHYHVGGTWVGAASWPSGHSTAALSLVLGAVLVSPRGLRPFVAAAGAAFAVVVGLFLLVLAWHMPSDVVGGYLVASMWTALAVTGLRLVERRRARRAATAAP